MWPVVGVWVGTWGWGACIGTVAVESLNRELFREGWVGEELGLALKAHLVGSLWDLILGSGLQGLTLGIDLEVWSLQP